jgi:hypothetical protein
VVRALAGGRACQLPQGRDRRAAAERHLARMDTLAAEVTKRVAAGMAPPTDSDAVTFYRAEAELWSTGKTH